MRTTSRPPERRTDDDAHPLTAAVREFGYAPYVLKPAREHGTFALSLKCYLHSGIPAVLVLEDPRAATMR